MFITQTYAYTPLYYGTPCQIRYYHAVNDCYYGAIAYKDFIICGHTGEVYNTDKVVEMAEAVGVPFELAVIEYGEWITLSDVIRGA